MDFLPIFIIGGLLIYVYIKFYKSTSSSSSTKESFQNSTSASDSVTKNMQPVASDQKLTDIFKQSINKLTNEFTFKKKKDSTKTDTDTDENANAKILNPTLASASSFAQEKIEVPELEHFEDYAPVIIPPNYDMTAPILPQSNIAPDTVKYNASDAPTGMPLASNGMTEFDNKVAFSSVRTQQFNNKLTGQDLSYDFTKVPTTFGAETVRYDSKLPA